MLHRSRQVQNVRGWLGAYEEIAMTSPFHKTFCVLAISDPLACFQEEFPRKIWFCFCEAKVRGSQRGRNHRQPVFCSWMAEWCGRHRIWLASHLLSWRCHFCGAPDGAIHGGHHQVPSYLGWWKNERRSKEVVLACNFWHEIKRRKSSRLNTIKIIWTIARIGEMLPLSWRVQTLQFGGIVMVHPSVVESAKIVSRNIWNAAEHAAKNPRHLSSWIFRVIRHNTRHQNRWNPTHSNCTGAQRYVTTHGRQHAEAGKRCKRNT